MQDAKNAESPMILIIEISRTTKNRRKAVCCWKRGETESEKPGAGLSFTTPGQIAIIKPQGKNRIRGDVWAKAAGFAASG